MNPVTFSIFVRASTICYWEKLCSCVSVEIGTLFYYFILSYVCEFHICAMVGSNCLCILKLLHFLRASAMMHF